MSRASSHSLAATTLAALTLAGLGGCRGGTSTEPPIVPFRGMHEMPRYDAQEYSRFFDDHRTMRPVVDGAVSREMEPDAEIAEGVDATGAYLETIPQAVVERRGGMASLLERGEARFGIYCAPCHGAAGDGRGMVSRRAEAIGNTFAAANLTDAQFLHIPDGRLYLTITNGVRTMPAYRAQIPLDDRWAIVAYVRALQLHAADPRAAAADTDADSVQAWADRCPDQAEDRDGFADADGCPDDDNDGDTVADGVDACPTAPGAANAAGGSGCPASVRVGADALQLLSRIDFERGSTERVAGTDAVLDEVRAVLAANPDMRLRVEVYTDDRGDDDANQTLTQMRAQSLVDWLVDQGIAGARLEARGGGEDSRMGDNNTAEGRLANNRVELRIAPSTRT